MSPPNTIYLLCREIICLSWNGRQASIEMGGKLTPWHTVFAWLFQTKLKSWNYFIIRGSYRKYRIAVSAFYFLILCVLLALSPFSPASSSFPLHFSLWISASQGAKALISFTIVSGLCPVTTGLFLWGDMLSSSLGKLCFLLTSSWGIRENLENRKKDP